MAGLPSAPGLPQKPVHTNLPLTRKDLEAAGAAGASKVSTEGGVPPRRQGYQNQPRSFYSDRYSRRSLSGDGYSRRSPSTDRYDRYSHRSAEPRASNNYTDRYDWYPPRSAEPRASNNHTYRPQSHSSFRGDQTHRHHPYSRPRGSAEPTTPADLKQPQAVTQRRAENQFSIRPDREPAARGRGRLAPLPRSGRDRQPAGQASAKPQGKRDGKMSVSDTTTTISKKRKASATPPPSPSPSDIEEGEILEEGEIPERPMKRQRTASVAASASSSGRVSTDKTANKGKRATPGRAFSPVASAAAAPVATSRPVTSRSTRKSALPTARPSTSTSAASRASDSAGIMTWVQSLNEDVLAASSGPAPASVNLADSSTAPASAPAPASLSVDTTLGKSPAKASVSPTPAPVSPVSSGAASDLAVSSAAAASPAPASESVVSATPANESAASAVSPVSPGPASELAAVTAAAPANVSVASAVIPAAETESPSTESSVHEKEYPSTSKSTQASSPAIKSPSAGLSTTTRSAQKTVVHAGKSLPVSEPASPGEAPAGKSPAGKSSTGKSLPGSEPASPRGTPTGKSLPETKTTLPRKSPPASKTGGGVKTGRVAKAKPKPKAKGKRGCPKKAEPEESDRPYVGGKTIWTGGSWSPPAKMASSSGGENEDQIQIDTTNHVDQAGVTSGIQDDEPSPASTTKPYATKKVPTPSSGGEKTSVLASIEAGGNNTDLVNPEAISSSAHPAVGGKTSWASSTPEPEDDDVLLEDAPDLSSIQVPGPVVAIPTAIPEVTDNIDEADSNEPTVLSKTEDAVWLDVRLGSAARQIQVDAIVLPGFSTWWSRQEPDQPLYNLDLSGVLGKANKKAERVITAEEVLHMLERMLLEMERSVEGGPGPDHAKYKPYSANDIWLAALMHDVLGLPQDVIKGMLSTLQGLWTDCREDGFPSDDALLLDAGLEKAIAAAETFGWDPLWRKMISRLAYTVTARVDGRLLHSGLVLQEGIGRKATGVILAARQQMVMAMTEKAMAYLQRFMRTEVFEGTCATRCSTTRMGAIYSALMAAGLSPWPKEDQSSAVLAGGRSICEIISSLHGTLDLLTSQAYLADLCGKYENPLAKLYEEVGSEIGDKLVKHFNDMPLGGY
ncbi:hypothetical protein V8F06_005622 [Rhypophila decipiens]